MVRSSDHEALVVLGVMGPAIIGAKQHRRTSPERDNPTGLAVKGSVEIGSDANHYLQSLLTDDTGNLAVKQLPFGVYLLEARPVIC